VRILIDTQLLLWAMASSRRLPKEARSLILDTANEVFYSAASVWEVAIKSALRRRDFRANPTVLVRALIQSGFAESLAGRADEALPLVAGAVEEFCDRQFHVRPGLILLCAGTTCLSAGRIDEAASHAREALALAGELGMRPLVAHCHLGLGKLYREQASASRRRSISPQRRRCTARWA
jgi:hypothetical protein